MQVINQSKMLTTRLHSAVVGGLPETPTGWPPSGCPRGSRGARNPSNAARIARNHNRDAANADGVINTSKEVGANKGVVMEDSNGADPHGNDPLHTVLMGMLASLRKRMSMSSSFQMPQTLRQLPSQACSPKMTNGMTGQNHLRSA